MALELLYYYFLFYFLLFILKADDLEKQEIDAYNKNEINYQNRLNATMQNIEEKSLVRRSNLPTGFCAKCRRDLNLNSAFSSNKNSACHCDY